MVRRFIQTSHFLGLLRRCFTLDAVFPSIHEELLQLCEARGNVVALLPIAVSLDYERIRIRSIVWGCSDLIMEDAWHERLQTLERDSQHSLRVHSESYNECLVGRYGEFY